MRARMQILSVAWPGLAWGHTTPLGATLPPSACTNSGDSHASFSRLIDASPASHSLPDVTWLKVTLGTAFAALCEGLNRGHTMPHGGEGRVARWDDVKVRPYGGVCCAYSRVVYKGGTGVGGHYD